MPTTIDSAGITFNDATSLTSANIGTAQLVNGSVTASKLGINEQKQICKAWVNFDGANAFIPNPSTTAIRSSYNVSSVTKNGTGDYTLNFATPMTDANYSAFASSSENPTISFPVISIYQYTISSVKLNIANSTSGTYFNPIVACLSIFGN